MITTLRELCGRYSDRETGVRYPAGRRAGGGLNLHVFHSILGNMKDSHKSSIPYREKIGIEVRE